MLVLDTDHIAELQKEDAVRGGPLTVRLQATAERVSVTIVSAEEQMRGWLAAIHRTREPYRQVPSYGKLRELFKFYSGWNVLPFDALAAGEFAALRKSGIRVGTMDLKIASIAKVLCAKLLLRNTVDFGRVPGVVVESWIS